MIIFTVIGLITAFYVAYRLGRGADQIRKMYTASGRKPDE